MTATEEREISDLHFEIQVWIRYFDMRRAFFSKLFLFHNTYIGVMMSLALIGIGMKDPVLTTASLFSALIIHLLSFIYGTRTSVLSGWAGAASFYDNARLRFYDLKELWHQEQFELVQKKKENFLMHQNFLLRDAYNKATWALAFNETCVAQGLPEKYRLTSWQKMRAHHSIFMRKAHIEIASPVTAIPDIQPIWF